MEDGSLDEEISSSDLSSPQKRALQSALSLKNKVTNDLKMVNEELEQKFEREKEEKTKLSQALRAKDDELTHKLDALQHSKEEEVHGRFFDRRGVRGRVSEFHEIPST